MGGNLSPVNATSKPISNKIVDSGYGFRTNEGAIKSVEVTGGGNTPKKTVIVFQNGSKLDFRGEKIRSADGITADSILGPTIGFTELNDKSTRVSLSDICGANFTGTDNYDDIVVYDSKNMDIDTKKGDDSVYIDKSEYIYVKSETSNTAPGYEDIPKYKDSPEQRISHRSFQATESKVIDITTGQGDDTVDMNNVETATIKTGKGADKVILRGTKGIDIDTGAEKTDKVMINNLVDGSKGFFIDDATIVTNGSVTNDTENTVKTKLLNYTVTAPQGSKTKPTVDVQYKKNVTVK